MEQSLHDRGDGDALIEQLRQEKSLQPEAWKVMGSQMSVPHTVFFIRLTKAVPYRRPAAVRVEDSDSTTGTTVGQTLFPRVAVVLPMAALFALVDAGGLAAMAGHLQAVRSSWKQQQKHLCTGGQQTEDTDCVVHYILESLPRSEKERGAVLRQHTPRPIVAGQAASGESRKKGATAAAARQRATMLEAVLLWIGVEVADVIVHHTENQSSSVDYLSRLAGKLGVSATSESIATDEVSSASRSREQFEAHAAWKPDYAALKLLAPQHSYSASQADTQDQAQQMPLHPLMKAYFAVLCAVRNRLIVVAQTRYVLHRVAHFATLFSDNVRNHLDV